jgi:hypothetical protein
MAVLHLSRSAVVIVVAQARCKNLRLGKQVRVGVLLAHCLSWIKAITLGACHLYWLPLSLQGVWHGEETTTSLTLSMALLVVLASPLQP